MSDVPPRPHNPHGLPKFVAAIKGLGQLMKSIEQSDHDEERARARAEHDTDRPLPGSPDAPPTCGETAPTGWHCTLSAIAHEQCLLERDRT